MIDFVSEIGCCRYDQTSGKDVSLLLNAWASFFRCFFFLTLSSCFPSTFHYWVYLRKTGSGVQGVWERHLSCNSWFSSRWSFHLPSSSGVHAWNGPEGYGCLGDQDSCRTSRGGWVKLWSKEFMPLLDWSKTTTTSTKGLFAASHMVNVKRSVCRFLLSWMGAELPQSIQRAH